MSFTQKSSLPIRKVSSAGIAGAIATTFLWIIKTYAGVEPPAEVQSAVIIVFMALVAYFMPPAVRDGVVQGPQVAN